MSAKIIMFDFPRRAVRPDPQRAPGSKIPESSMENIRKNSGEALHLKDSPSLLYE